MEYNNIAQHSTVQCNAMQFKKQYSIAIYDIVWYLVDKIP